MALPKPNYFDQIKSVLTDLAEVISRDYDALYSAAMQACKEEKSDSADGRTEEEESRYQGLVRAHNLLKKEGVFWNTASQICEKHELSESQECIVRAVLFSSPILGEDVRPGADSILNRLATGEIDELPLWSAFDRLNTLKEHYRSGWVKHENGVHAVLFHESSLDSNIDPLVKVVFMSHGDPVITSILGDTLRAVKTGNQMVLESFKQPVLKGKDISDIIEIGTAVTPDGLSKIQEIMGLEGPGQSR